VTSPRRAGRTPGGYLHRAVDALFTDVPQWVRWAFVWVALLCALMVVCFVLVVVASLALGVV